jgi:hypothetical protein
MHSRYVHANESYVGLTSTTIQKLGAASIVSLIHLNEQLNPRSLIFSIDAVRYHEIQSALIFRAHHILNSGRDALLWSVLVD